MKASPDMTVNDHAGQASVSMDTASADQGPMKVAEIVIKPTDNGGYTLTTIKEPEHAKSTLGGMMMAKPETASFEDLKSAMDHVQMLLGGAAEDGATADDGAGDSGDEPQPGDAPGSAMDDAGDDSGAGPGTRSATA